MNTKKMQKGCALFLVGYLVLAVLFFWIGGEQLHIRETSTDMVSASSNVAEIVQGVELRQRFTATGEEVRGITVLASGYGRNNDSHLTVCIEDQQGQILASSTVHVTDIVNDLNKDISFSEPVHTMRGERYTLVITSDDAVSGNAVTLWVGNTRYTARAAVVLELAQEDKLTVNGEVRDGMLCFRLHEREHLRFGELYWYLVLGGGILLVLYEGYLLHTVKKNRSTAVLRLIDAFSRYGYLMRQLIARDFKTKYKRSVLGVVWSFLNPLLTMLVQYIVFSTLFMSDIDNFPLYLLTGIVCFNFFSEACGMALMAVVGNASLITKVYVPKYIYPVSRVFSSVVNLLLSMIPLLIVMLLTRTPITPALLLLPFGLVCLVSFCVGMGLFLSTAMVFFRDTQFLWGVISMLWMYLTPIFYPESIIPEQFLGLYRCNPLYQIIRFFRIVLMEGISPDPGTYGMCLLVSVIPLVLGAIIFKKNQDKFILNL